MWLCDICETEHTERPERCSACEYKRTHYAPNLEEIERQRNLIRDGWNATQERAHRGVKSDEQYTIPHMRHHPRGHRVHRGSRKES